MMAYVRLARRLLSRARLLMLNVTFASPMRQMVRMPIATTISTREKPERRRERRRFISEHLHEPGAAHANAFRIRDAPTDGRDRDRHGVGGETVGEDLDERARCGDFANPEAIIPVCEVERVAQRISVAVQEREPQHRRGPHQPDRSAVSSGY